MTYADWRDAPNLVMDGGTLVDLDTGFRYQTMNACGSSGHATWSVCTSLGLARSLFGLCIAKIAIGNVTRTGSKRVPETQLEVKVNVECRACNARQSYSETGCPLWMPLWLSKNLERSQAVSTGIIWLITQRPDDERTKRALGVWAKNNVNWMVEASRLALIGNSSEVEWTKPSPLVQEQRLPT